MHPFGLLQSLANCSEYWTRCSILGSCMSSLFLKAHNVPAAP